MKVFIVVEDYRNEYCGDSTENVSLIGVYTDREKALKVVTEKHDSVLGEMKKVYDDDRIHSDIGDYGSECYLEGEYDTYHCDYVIFESEVV